jgi:ribosome-associated protein
VTSRTTAKKIAGFMLTKKAFDVVILDLRKLVGAADYFVLCSADSDTQVKAVADAVRAGMEDIGESIYHYEGYHASRWVLLDYVDVVAHVFHKEERSFYNLDKLWGDAKRMVVEDEALPPSKAPSGVKRRQSKKKRVEKE